MKIFTNYKVSNSNYYKYNNSKQTPFKASGHSIKTVNHSAIFALFATGYVTILNALDKCNTTMKETDKFINIREELSKRLEPAVIEAGIADWNFYTNSTPENMEKMQEAWDKCQKIYLDEETFEKLKNINPEKLAKHEAKQLKDLLKNFDDEINTGEEQKALRNKQNEIAQKYNGYIPKIDGKETTSTELKKILQTEENEGIRQKAYEAKIKGGDLIANDLVDLVKMRNKYAQTKGFNNYFEYMLKDTYDVDTEFLDKLIDEVYSFAHTKIKTIQEKKQENLKQLYKTNTLNAYHYGILLKDDPSKTINQILEGKAQNNPKLIEEITKKAYYGMGYDTDKMLKTAVLTWDLYPRKNKNTHGFCFDIDAGKDARILANLTNNVYSIDTLNHEMGHCVYKLGIPTDLPYLDKDCASAAMTEAIAMMMGDLMKTENILKGYVSEDILALFKKTHSEDEAEFVSRSLLIIDFEREFYKNPEQDPKTLWNNLKQKYLNRDGENADNEWATIPHYLSHPAYYQNYFRATLMKAQIYNHLVSKLGNITENNNTSNYLIDNIFKYGALIDEYDLIKQLTGNSFTAKYFTDTLK